MDTGKHGRAGMRQVEVHRVRIPPEICSAYLMDMVGACLCDPRSTAEGYEPEPTAAILSPAL